MKKVLVLLLSLLFFASCGTSFLTDDLGENIEQGLSPERIISLTPNMTEIVYYLGLGDKLVGRTSFCNYPEEVSDVPVVGDIMNLSVENILDLEPDLVLVNRMIPMEVVDQLRKISSRKITVASFDPQSIEDIFNTIERIAQICGVDPNTDELKERMESVKSSVPEVLVYFEIWGDPPMTVGKNTYQADLIRWLGARNLSDDMVGDFPTISHETIIDLNPDVIILPDPYQDNTESVSDRPGYSNISAIESGRIFNLNSDILMRPGPRMVEAAHLLIKALED
ncbi:MAG TPA: cobalamin-binding protein [Caldisericia bacterium]|nr:cobalamin-binding protein [Caldisericia bacterium]HPF49067.1 cobalamin-binding protein [Caldisericia bacterium]HPI83069.1 cobalamin-binding protein [Caldisericia bacterium]HPQ92296.1 cobalamin-binding protein [Caldisericia bacterium]HRV74606.1 cobalamin-binding protein [Caldisericia bacterium]